MERVILPRKVVARGGKWLMPRHGMVLCPCYSISLGYFQYWCSLAFFPSIDYIELESVTLVAVLQLKVAIVLSVRRGGGGTDSGDRRRPYKSLGSGKD